jgi:hypothetical protein
MSPQKLTTTWHSGWGVGLVATALIVALGPGTPAQTTPPTITAPRAVVLRLDAPNATQATVVGVLEPGNRAWRDGPATSPASQAAIRTGLRAIVVGPSRQMGSLTTTNAWNTDELCDWVRTTGAKLNLSAAFSKANAPFYAVHAAWNPIPRQMSAISTSSNTYLEVVRSELARLGLKSSPKITQALRGDLDGDGSDEVLIVAQTKPNAFENNQLQPRYESAVGEYSLVFVRKIMGSTVKTFTLGQPRIVTKLANGEDNRFPLVLTQYISAVADIDGDGKLEVFVDDFVHEGLGVAIYSWNGKDFQKTLEWGCGV